jgi:hypothetical protein
MNNLTAILLFAAGTGMFIWEFLLSVFGEKEHERSADQPA